MELRILRSFLEIAREENMTRAAERLHISQPSLSKQMKDLEGELGKKLFIRSSYSMHLTEEGMILRKRAEDLLSLSDKIIDEFKSMDDITGGDVYIGCAESHLIRYLALAVRNVSPKYPMIHYHITSGGTELVTEHLNKGLIDLAFIVEPPNLAKYSYIEVPGYDLWGAVMRKDFPLSQKERITVEDILPYPVFCSEQSLSADIPRWCAEKIDRLNVTASFNLATNATMFVKEGLGVLLTFAGLTDLGAESLLCFRPLYPELKNKMYVIWRKYQVFTPASRLLLDELEKVFSS